MFSQCFCELATQVAEMLCQHLSLLDSEINGHKRNKQKERETGEGNSGQKKQEDGLRRFTWTENKLQ